MVGRDVQEHADGRAKGVDVLELEARQLADDPGVGLGLAVERGQRTADVPGDLDGPSGGAEDRAEKLGRGRLPVRAGDAEDRVREEPVAELDLAPHGQGTLARSGDERRLRRNPGAFHKQVHAVEQRGVVRAESNFYALRPKPSRVELLVSVDREHGHAVPHERPRGGLPGAGEPEDESVCG